MCLCVYIYVHIFHGRMGRVSRICCVEIGSNGTTITMLLEEVVYHLGVVS